jgi:hypothetical protein
VTVEREDEAHRLVPEVCGGVEHARAAAVDDGDAALPSVRGGRLRDAARAEGAVHPDVLDAELGALAHRLLGNIRPRSDYDGINAARD